MFFLKKFLNLPPLPIPLPKGIMASVVGFAGGGGDCRGDKFIVDTL
jgi:hypothetical protein